MACEKFAFFILFCNFAFVGLRYSVSVSNNLFSTIKMKQFIYLLISFSVIACGKKTTNKDLNAKMDNVIVKVMDSVYSNQAYSRSILETAMKTTKDSLDFYKGLQTLSSICFVGGNIDSALLTAGQVIAFTDRQKLTEPTHLLRSLAYNSIGNCFAHIRKQDSALYYYKKALDSYSLSGEAKKMPDLYINIADMYTRKGDYSQSALYFRKALSVTDSLRMGEHFEFPIYVGLAQLYMELRDFELSDHYFSLAEKHYNERSLSEQFFFCNSRGNFYFFAEEYAEALPWYRKGKALLIPGGYLFNINLLNANMGEIFFHLNQPDSAHRYLDEAHAFFSGTNDLPLLYHVETVKAGLALKEDKPLLARRYLKDENRKLESGLEPTFIHLRNKYIQEYYARTGNFREAYTYLLNNVALDDSIRSERTKMRIAEIDLRYSQDTTLIKKEMQIAEQASDIRELRTRNLMWVIISLLIVALAFMQYLFLKKQKEQQWVKMQGQMTRLRMLNIRNRISPHFMFNVLNREISTGDDTHRSNLEGLVLMLRRSLELTDSTHVTLSQELEFVQAYIRLEKMSLGPDFRVEWQIDPQVAPDAVMVPPMIIQIPVENAVKHALRPLTTEKILSVSVAKEGKGTAIVVKDNGRCYKPGEVNTFTGTGTGLKVLYQTIDLLNAVNREKMTFTIKSATEGLNGTLVYIYVPNNYEFE